MKDPRLIDFHHGWLIEIVPSDNGFQAVSYSPCRKRLISQYHHSSSFDAFHAAKREIDHQIALSSLSTVLRELYEADYLCFEEWTLLQNSLQQVIR